jgi:hypothetical protein
MVLLVLVVVFGYLAWRQFRKPVTKEDMPPLQDVLSANNRGLGYMEQYDYPSAELAFRDLVSKAPDWIPGRVNLAIALLNQNTAPKLDEAVEVFRGILAKEPENRHALYCLGIIAEHRGQTAEAIEHFKKVVELDPNDADAWLHLGKTWHTLAQNPDEQADQAMRESLACYERSRQLNPYLASATYALAMFARANDQARTKKLLDEFGDLTRVAWTEGPQKELRYTEMGKYAEVISFAQPPQARQMEPLPLFIRDDKLPIRLRSGARWSGAADFGAGAEADLRRQLRARFGGVLVTLDYNHDGKPDLLLLGAVVEKGKVCDLLLRNDGENGFTDVTNDAGLGGPHSSVGCSVADFNNDGYPDLFITGIGQQRLLRNNRRGQFENVTKEAGLEKLNAVCLGSLFVDLDQDGDLDLLVAQFAPTVETALDLLRGPPPSKPGAGGLAVFLNVGEATASSPKDDPPALSPRFQRVEKPPELIGETQPATAIASADLDDDNDLDLLVLADQAVPSMLINDRLLRFRRTAMPADLVGAGRWNGALVLDADNDRRSDLFLVPAGAPPLLLLNRSAATEHGKVIKFEKGVTNSPALLHAQAVDIDLDGWTDIVGLSADHKPVLLHNDGQRLSHVPEQLGADAAWPRDVIGLGVAHFSQQHAFPDLLVWSESAGLQVHRNQRNSNRGILLDVTGHRHVGEKGEPMRSNADAVGLKVTAQVDDHSASVENTTQSAGLGQSRRPIQLGLGRKTQADVIRLRWPDLVVQAELNVASGQLVRIDERNRKDTSCPILFTWDGERFVFVNDFLGAGSIGELQPDGNCRTPRPEESVKIEAQQLAPRDGYYVLKIAEPMNEVIYLDKLQLTTIDHPADVSVYPDERFASIGASASQDLLAFRRAIFPVRALDHRGRDVTQALRSFDRQTVDGFARRSWLGYAEEHWVELDFGDRLSTLTANDRLVLGMAGWTDYPYPESIWAATQAGVALQQPILERLEADGKWHTIVEDAGFPAGLPRMTTLDVTGKLGGPTCRLRLRTNMHVYWDQIFAAPLLERIPANSVGGSVRDSTILRTTPLELADAFLEVRGCAQEFSPDGHLPTIYDHDRREPVPVVRLAGRLTQTGPVTELLRDHDDRFAIFGPGEEVTVRFDARYLPKLPVGWKRSFVLRAWGYSKDSGAFTATGEMIEPLPFRRMSKYPYGPNEHFPDDPLHTEYKRIYNTRQVGELTSQSRPQR